MPWPANMLATLRTRLSFLLLAAALAGPAAHAQDAAQLDHAYQAALQAESDALRTRIQKWPPAMQALNSQVSAALRAGNRDEARRLAENMARQEPGNADVKLFLGKLQGQQGNMAAALDLFGQSIALDPGNKWAYINKAGAQAERSDMPNALATTRALTARFPDWSIGYNLQASLLDAMDREAEALDAYAKAVLAKPASALILTNLGNLQRRLGRLDDARLSYEAALRVQPGYAYTETQLASMPR
ncbi:Beta-barrel assembly-enhancing protease [compost metagenome]